MGKLTAMGVKNLTEPGRYSDGEGLILKLAAKGKGAGLSAFRPMESAETLV